MISEKKPSHDHNHAEYHNPPRRWPFHSLGRKAFLATGVFLLTLILLPFWGSIAVAAVFAFGLHSPMEKVSRYFGNRRRLTAALLVMSLTMLLFFPATLLGLRVYELVADAGKGSGAISGKTLAQVEGAYRKVEDWAVQYGVGAKIFASGGDVQASLRKGGSAILTKILAGVSAFATSLPEITITLLVFGLFLYTFLAYPNEIRRFVFRLHLFRSRDLDRSIKILQSSSYDSLVANFLVGTLQASVVTLGAWILGYRESVLIFSVVFAVSYIPFIGAAPVGYVIALVILLNEGITPALIMAAIATFTGVIDNVARPYLVSNGKNEIHPVLSFAAILGAIAILGLKGIFLGPVILTTTVALLGNSDSAEEKNRAAIKAEAGKNSQNQKHYGHGLISYFRRLTGKKGARAA